MQFITIKTSTTVTALTHQVFDIRGAKATAITRQLQIALREANPHWGDVTKLPAGTLVVVPDVPGVRASAPQSSAALSPAVLAQLQQVLADAKKVFAQSTEASVREIETGLSLAKSRELLAFAKQTPDLQARLSRMVEQSKLQLKQIETTRKEQLQDLAQLEKDLGSLSQ